MGIDVIIVGGGISGFYCAYLLLEADPTLNIKIIEARDRIGGRLYSPNRHDMGGTWTWPRDDFLVMELVDKLQIPVFDADTFQEKNAYTQQLRFVQGAQQLVKELARAVTPRVEVCLAEQVTRIVQNQQDQDCGVEIYTHQHNNHIKDHLQLSCKYHARSVVLALPPRIIAANITFEPPLKAQKCEMMVQTPTWMAGASKVFLEYASPFWKSSPSQHPLPLSMRDGIMLYDASQYDPKRYVLCAFYAGIPVQITNESIQRDLLPQLQVIFGNTNEVFKYTSVMFHNWMDEKYTCEDKIRLQHENRTCMGEMYSFGDEILREPVSHKIYFASTETENDYGHIQGALRSSKRVVDQMLYTKE